jgi:hypothetical protein
MHHIHVSIYITPSIHSAANLKPTTAKQEHPFEKFFFPANKTRLMLALTLELLRFHFTKCTPHSTPSWNGSRANPI